MDTTAIRTDSVWVPISFAARAVGMRVYWDHYARIATIINHNGEVVVIPDGSMTMYIDGRAVLLIGDHGLPVAAHIRDDRILIPKGMVSIALDMELMWSEELRTAFYWFRPQGAPGYFFRHELRIPIGFPAMFLDGETMGMDTTAHINPLNMTKMVPIGFVARTLGLDVHWNHDARRADIIDHLGRTLTIYADDDTMSLNGMTLPIRNQNEELTTAIIRDDRLFVPITTIEEVFGLRAHREGIVSVLPVHDTIVLTHPMHPLYRISVAIEMAGY